MRRVREERFDEMLWLVEVKTLESDSDLVLFFIYNVGKIKKDFIENDY